MSEQENTVLQEKTTALETTETVSSDEMAMAEAMMQEQVPDATQEAQIASTPALAQEAVETPTDHKSSELANFLDDVNGKLNDFERFVSRRFDEISMEVNATSQQMDMAEEGMAKKFGEILEILTAVSYAGDGSTQANTGVELEAVVDLTNNAANKIMDAADRISNSLQDEEKWDDPDTRGGAVIEVETAVSEIYMACTFQDLTSQRIRTALENIRGVEERLSSTLEKMGIKIPERVGGPETGIKTTEEIVFENTARSQEEIDKLFD